MSLNGSKVRKTMVVTLLTGILFLSTSLITLSVGPASGSDPRDPPVGGTAPSVVTRNWEMIN